MRAVTGAEQRRVVYQASVEGEVVYVGQTRKGLDERARRHLQAARDPNRESSFIRLIRQVGEDAITFEAIESVASEQELDEREVHWISKLRPRCNIQKGGTHQRQSEAALEARRRANTGENHWNYGRKASAQTRAKLRASRQDGRVMSADARQRLSQMMSGEGSPTFGRRHTDEERAKMSAAAKGNARRRGARLSDEQKEVLRQRAHVQWHERRGITNPDCHYCRETIPAAA